MAKIKIFCPHCGQSLQCDASCQGKQVRCPPCGQLFLVPQMPIHTTLNEDAKVQLSDAATAFRNDFFEKYPDLLPHESLVGNVAKWKMAQAIKANEYKGASDFLCTQQTAWDVAVKLQASEYKGGSREAVMETIAKAVRQEIARQQKNPPIIGVGQSNPAATSSQNTPREWVELDRREDPEDTKVFYFGWGGGLLVLLIYQARTAALSWFLGFPIAWWLYHKIKNR